MFVLESFGCVEFFISIIVIVFVLGSFIGFFFLVKGV